MSHGFSYEEKENKVEPNEKLLLIKCRDRYEIEYSITNSIQTYNKDASTKFYIFLKNIEKYQNKIFMKKSDSNKNTEHTRKNKFFIMMFPCV